MTSPALAHRQDGPPDGPPVLLVHGFPESSAMWRALIAELGRAGWRAIAPDLAGYGDSPPDPPGTWERHVESLERFRRDLGIGPAVLVVHDWGGLIGLRWACDHPDAVRALVISSTGFFPEGRWHGLATAMRTPGEGEELVEGMTRERFGGGMRALMPAFDDATLDEYWKCYADPVRRRGHLELYRSGDFEKLTPYEGRLAALGVPALLVWGARDEFAPVGGAHRFRAQLPDARLVVIEDAGHFVWEESPARCSEAVLDFLAELAA